MNNRQFTIAVLTLIIIAIASFVIAITLGAADISITNVIDAVVFHKTDNLDQSIIIQTRFPRVISVACSGILLAVAGYLTQLVTRNDLGDPSLLGTNAGSYFMVVVFYAFFAGLGNQYVFAFSLFGAILTSVFLIILSFGKESAGSFKIIIVGTVINAFFMAVTNILAINTQQLARVNMYNAGGFSGIDTQYVPVLIWLSIITIIFVITHLRRINLLSLDDGLVKSLGFNPDLNRLRFLIMIVLIQGVSVAITGPVFYIGLIIPHFCKSIFKGTKASMQVILVALVGMIALLLLDLGTRFIIQGIEIPINILLGVIVGPILIYVINKKGGSRA